MNQIRISSKFAEGYLGRKLTREEFSHLWSRYCKEGMYKENGNSYIVPFGDYLRTLE